MEQFAALIAFSIQAIAELTARGLKSFSRNEPSLAETVVLPGLWPPRSNPSAAIEMLMASPAHYYGDNWADNGTRVEKERASERERMAAHYEQMTREQTERSNREEREAVAQRVQQR